MSLVLPSAIRQFVGSAELVPDPVGESPCQVFRFQRGSDTFYLKVSGAVYAPTTYSVAREAAVTAWLAPFLNVPEVLLTGMDSGREYMVTRRVPGRPLSTRLNSTALVLEAFQEALRQLWAVPVVACPFKSTAEVRLNELSYLLEHELVAGDANFSLWPGIHTPAALLAHLRACRPPEELVFSHGDLNDSNVFIDERDSLHFIDLGRAGQADRWLDIAFACRNLREDLSPDAEHEFLTRLRLTDQPEKRLYFEQLDEMF